MGSREVFSIGNTILFIQAKTTKISSLPPRRNIIPLSSELTLTINVTEYEKFLYFTTSGAIWENSHN